MRKTTCCCRNAPIARSVVRISSEALSLAREIVGRLKRDERPERTFPSSRVVVALDNGADLAQKTFELGKLKVRSYVTAPFDDNALRREINRILAVGRKVGKVALCLSGGGVEGLLFELGVLRALNAYLERRSITECDIICGISAGSILAALMALVAAVITGLVRVARNLPEDRGE